MENSISNTALLSLITDPSQLAYEYLNDTISSSDDLSDVDAAIQSMIDSLRRASAKLTNIDLDWETKIIN